MKISKDKSGVSAKGIHTLSVCDMTSRRAMTLERWISDLVQRRNFLIKTGRTTERAITRIHDEYLEIISELHKHFLVRKNVIENITTTVGRSALAQRLCNITTYTGIVNYCALGSNNAVPIVGNVKLGTETYRKALSTGAASSNVAYLETFFTKTEVTGTFEEYGFFIDGTGAADSGQLLNRFTGSTTKSGTESLNVQSTITLSDA